jgi:hypothetical protein
MIKTHTEEQSQLTRLTVEELADFKKVHEEYQKVLFDLGINAIDIEETKKKLDELNKNKIDLISQIKEINDKRLTLTTKLANKYGDKQVDLETGDLR